MEAPTLFLRWFHFSRRVRLSGSHLILLRRGRRLRVCWDSDRWNIDRYRDERAVDIEQRLERTEPIVKNPF